jgi:hypothetical protein
VLHAGDPLEAAERLRSLLGTGADQSGGAADRADRPRVAAARLFDPAAADQKVRVHKGQFQGGEGMAVEFDVTVPDRSSPVAVRMAVTGPADVPMWVMDSGPLHPGPGGTATVRFTVKELPQIKGIYALAVAVRDPARNLTYDARRFPEAFVAVGDTDTGVLEVVWTAEQVEPQAEPQVER